jgi:hypothetical protein
LDCADVPRVETGDMPSDRITLQDLVPDTLSPVLGSDAVMTGANTKNSLPPPNITLDYMYGAAAYKRWGGRAGEIHEVMKIYHTAHYKDIHRPECDDGDGDGGSGGSGDEDSSSDYEDPKPRRRNTVRREHKDMSDGMLEAMDNIRYLSMMLRGITPHAVAVERQKQEEEAESRAHEASCIKVQKWITG